MKRLVLALLLAATPALAEEVGCPDLSQAVQVGDCPSEAQLKYSYAGYCSDDARMNDKGSDTSCTSLDEFKKLKNHALWEAGDFQGYLQCSRAPQETKALKLLNLSVAPAGKLTRVVCSYEGGALMVMRTRRNCQQQGDKAVCD
ncbi:hypothetical protein [Magnetospirillum sp. 64-120]|uniref:hypothetical protein n=1 Tax=Magnetospirillum sp. 64-120 TaxID=1895778 RepID=UPI000929D001|nr:hypothetical protein [Magnetospirillum sp. 64-120]OJX70246.1 MAG: hypothetical protein BGO92_06565 [Magnetospirillum sp. 64-120]